MELVRSERLDECWEGVNGVIGLPQTELTREVIAPTTNRSAATALRAGVCSSGSQVADGLEASEQEGGRGRGKTRLTELASVGASPAMNVAFRERAGKGIASGDLRNGAFQSADESGHGGEATTGLSGLARLVVPPAIDFAGHDGTGKVLSGDELGNVFEPRDWLKDSSRCVRGAIAELPFRVVSSAENASRLCSHAAMASTQGKLDCVGKRSHLRVGIWIINDDRAWQGDSTVGGEKVASASESSVASIAPAGHVAVVLDDATVLASDPERRYVVACRNSARCRKGGLNQPGLTPDARTPAVDLGLSVGCECDSASVGLPGVH